MTSKKEPLKRLRVDLSEKEMMAFDALIDEGGLKTRKDVFDYAMTFLHWAVAEAREGRDIASVDATRKGPVGILRTPLLDLVKFKSEKSQPA